MPAIRPAWVEMEGVSADLKISEDKLADYLDHWMAEEGYERLLSNRSTQVIDVCHINDPQGSHRTAIICDNELVLLFPPAE
jgi:hypothetical protein